MSQDNLFRRLEAAINGKPNAWFGANGMSSELIVEAEKALGVEFPPSFRHYLATYGHCAIPGVYEVAGYYGEADVNLSALVMDTLDERKAEGIPESLVLLLNEDGERKFFLDTSRRDSHGECPVIESDLGFYNADGDRDYADSFIEFLLRRLRTIE